MCSNFDMRDSENATIQILRSDSSTKICTRRRRTKWCIQVFLINQVGFSPIECWRKHVTVHPNETEKGCLLDPKGWTQFGRSVAGASINHCLDHFIAFRIGVAQGFRGWLCLSPGVAVKEIGKNFAEPRFGYIMFWFEIGTRHIQKVAKSFQFSIAATESRFNSMKFPVKNSTRHKRSDLFIKKNIEMGLFFGRVNFLRQFIQCVDERSRFLRLYNKKKRQKHNIEQEL